MLQQQTILEQLRSGTSTLHQQLENLPLSRSIQNPNLRLEEYVAYLLPMHDLMQAVETHIFPLVGQVIHDLERRKKYPLIRQDVDAIAQTGAGRIAVKDEPATNQAVLSLLRRPKAELIPYALGVMYVVEGSTLGGRVILKNVRQALGLDAGNGAAYFSGYGEETGSMWKSFLQTLDEYATIHGQEAHMVQGAVDTFQVFYNTFTLNTYAP